MAFISVKPLYQNSNISCYFGVRGSGKHRPVDPATMAPLSMLQPLLPYTPDRDVYRLLGVPASASTDEITAACRRLARTFHPDHNASPRATAEMQVVNTVRKVLTDPDTRALYDRERRALPRQPGARGVPRAHNRPIRAGVFAAGPAIPDRAVRAGNARRRPGDRVGAASPAVLRVPGSRPGRRGRVLRGLRHPPPARSLTRPRRGAGSPARGRSPAQRSRASARPAWTPRPGTARGAPRRRCARR